MHHCLEVADILKMVLDAIDGDPKSWVTEQREVYASMARVCKSFYELASDALWANVPSFEAFAPLLPECLKEIVRRRSPLWLKRITKLTPEYDLAARA